MKKQNVIIAVVVLFLGVAGFGFVTSQSDEPEQSPVSNSIEVTVDEDALTISDDGMQLSYSGEPGVSALETLRTETSVATESSDFGEFVTTINGLEADSSSEYWAFYVNGELAPVGAGSYIANDSDQIEWKLESF